MAYKNSDDRYPDELFQINALPCSGSDLRCIICYDVMLHSVRCPQDCCFCKSCAEEALKTKSSCPGCRMPLTKDKLLINRKLNNIIGELVVVCRYSKQYEAVVNEVHSSLANSCNSMSIMDNNKKRKLADENDNEQKKTTDEMLCGWSGRLSELENHMKTCQFVFVKCRICSIRCRRCLLSQHKAEAHKSVKCPRCDKTVSESNFENHSKLTCKKRLEECEYCKVTFPYHVLSGQHKSVCDMMPIECPYKDITGCTFSCTRKDMPTHAMDSAIHMTGLFSLLSDFKNTCESLSEARCESVITELAREIENPLLHQIDDTADIFEDEVSNLTQKLCCLLDLVLPTVNDPVIGTPFERKVRTTEEQLRKNRKYLNDRLAPSLLGYILLNQFKYESEQIGHTLFAIYGLYYDGSCMLYFENFEKLDIFSFLETTISLSEFSISALNIIEPAFLALGSCMSSMKKCCSYSHDSMIDDIGIKVVEMLRSFITDNFDNVDYMTVVTYVMKGLLRNYDAFGNIDFLLKSNIMEIYSALLTNHMKSSEIVRNLTSALPKIVADWSVGVEQRNESNEAIVMNTHIAENGLCELLVSVASGYEDERCRKDAKYFIDWLLNFDKSYSFTCSEKIKAAQTAHQPIRNKKCNITTSLTSGSV